MINHVLNLSPQVDQSGEAVAFGIAIENPDEEKGVRLVFVDVNGATMNKEGGKILKMTFKVLNENGGKIVLANEYDSEFGYDTSVYVLGQNDFSTFYEGKNMKLVDAQIELK